jgi:hypothetical protein
MSDNVNHPRHYGGADDPYEVIKIAEAKLTREEFIGAMKFNIWKYQMREKDKGGDEDLQKSVVYSTFLSEYLKKSPKRRF